MVKIFFDFNFNKLYSPFQYPDITRRAEYASRNICFSPIMSFLHNYEFNKCVKHYNGIHRIKNFTCLNQFYAMAFTQLTYRESLRDIEACLNAIRY
jgi:hypothetical protein